MASNKLKVQLFRTNDLSEDTGKQFELGRSWCDFFEIDNSVGDIAFNLKFKPLSKAHENLKDRQIELKLSSPTSRNDRKAYSNGANSGYSAIKEFFINDLHLTLQNNSSDYFAVYKASEFDYYLYYIPKLLHDNFIRFFETVNPLVTILRTQDKTDNKDYELQQIFYGAPGTGKSNIIKKLVDEQNKRCHRITFHPDSDYSTFVGAYKPTMKVSSITKDGVTTKEEKIVYKFCPQAFTNAYVEAWNTEEEVYLIIEEINRGNCAQIFGDLFQLLDRKNGVSEYPVDADADLAAYIRKELEDSPRQDIPQCIKEGKKLMLPSNLYIWATMNTSDQSLFPIDSAFKRRWEWKYMKIKKGKDDLGNELNWKIAIKDNDGNLVKINGEDSLPWWNFIEKINEIIASMTSSADKQLGYFFCKAGNDGEIPADKFVSKVIFYLWNDVFKDYGFEDAYLFQYTVKDSDGKDTEKDLTFPDFYEEDGENINTERLADFLTKVMNWKKTAEDNN